MQNTPEVEAKTCLAILEGGKGSKNWLGNLPKGTSFLTREYSSSANTFILKMYQIVESMDGAVLLMEPNYKPGLPCNFGWVEPSKFSVLMDPYKIFLSGEKEDEDRSSEEGT